MLRKWYSHKKAISTVFFCFTLTKFPMLRHLNRNFDFFQLFFDEKYLYSQSRCSYLVVSNFRDFLYPMDPNSFQLVLSCRKVFKFGGFFELNVHTRNAKKYIHTKYIYAKTISRKDDWWLFIVFRKDRHILGPLFSFKSHSTFIVFSSFYTKLKKNISGTKLFLGWGASIVEIKILPFSTTLDNLLVHSR